MTKERKGEILKEFARTEGDTGSVEVQVALLTERINEVTDHLRIHKHDEHSRRGLFMMVGKRKKLLRYLESEDIDRYRTLISKDSTGYAYSLPAGTKITMIDLINNKYYYYIVKTSDVSSEKNEYRLSEFLEMPTTNQYYNETAAIATYQDTTNNIVQEKFIFHVDFKETTITQTSTGNTLVMELRNSEGRTIASVLGSQRETGKYGKGGRNS